MNEFDLTAELTPEQRAAAEEIIQRTTIATNEQLASIGNTDERHNRYTNLSPGDSIIRLPYCAGVVVLKISDEEIINAVRSISVACLEKHTRVQEFLDSLESTSSEDTDE